MFACLAGKSLRVIEGGLLGCCLAPTPAPSNVSRSGDSAAWGGLCQHESCAYMHASPILTAVCNLDSAPDLLFLDDGILWRVV